MAGKNREKVVQQYFDLFTKDFKADPKPVIIWVDNGNGTKSYNENRIELPKNLKIKMPYIVFIIFVKILKFDFQGRWEKVAWEIPVLYKGIPFILAHRKFGFSISTRPREEIDVNELAVEAIEMIHKAIPYAETLIAPEIKKLINEGRITLSNEYLEIRDRYQFFRQKANLEFTNTKKETEMSKLIREMRDEPFKTRHGQYHLIAMLDAYYSMLEHLLVLLIPFLKVELPEEITLEKFISANWKDKYNLVLSGLKDKSVALHLDNLIKIKEQYRNPISHGHFQKNGASIYVHMKNLGAIPMVLTKSKSNLSYGFNELSVITFKDICKAFDALDHFLDEHPDTKHALKYMKTTFPVAFDRRSKQEYSHAMKSDEKFGEFLDSTGRKLDNAMNMDW